MIWEAFSGKGKLPISVIGYIMDFIKYNELLADNFDGDYIFQQDNAPIHVSKQSLGWFKEKSIPLLDWPASSCDCNPMDNLWAISKVCTNGGQF